MNELIQYTNANKQAFRVITALQGDRSISEIYEAKHKLEKIGEESKEKLSHVYIEYLDAILSYREDRFQQALGQFEQLLEAIKQPDEWALYPHICVYIGTIQAQRGQYLISQHFFTQAEATFEAAEPRTLTFLNVNLSGISLQLKEWSKALEYSVKALEQSNAQDYDSAYSMALLNASLASTMLGSLDDAENYLQQCECYCDQRNLRHAKAYYALYLAVWHQYKQDVVSAQQSYKDAFASLKGLTDPLLHVEFFHFYGQFLYQIGQYPQALEFLSQVFSSKALSENPREKLSLYRIAVKCYQKVGDLDNEVKYLRRITSLQDDVIEMRRAQELEHLRRVSTVHEESLASQQSLLIQDRLSVLNELGQMLNNGDVEHQKLASIFDSLEDLLPISAFSLAYYDAESNELNYQYVLENGYFHSPYKVKCDAVSHIGVYSAIHKKTVRLNTSSPQEISLYLESARVPDDVRCGSIGEEWQGASVIFVPVIYQSQLLAVMGVQSNQCHEYSITHEKVVEQLASYVAVAISHHNQKKELASHNQFLEQIYHTDHLTGLKNRYGFFSWIADRVNAAKAPNGVILVSMDGLKRFNRRFSREQGDDSLVETASLIQQHISSELLVFRYQSDVFLVSGQFESNQYLETLAVTLQSMIKEYFNITYADSNTLSSTVGVCQLDEQMCRNGYESRVSELESALYRVKAQSSDGVFVLNS